MVPFPSRRPKPERPDKPKKAKRFRSPAHLKFVREHACCACHSYDQIEAAHVRSGTDGGMGMKPGDYWVISLCRACHARQHAIGEGPFEEETGIDTKYLARQFVNVSPKRRELERARDE